MSERKTLTMSPEILAQRLEAAAIHYQATAKRAEEEPKNAAVDRLAAQLNAQAAECLEWAESLRNEILCVGFEGDDLSVDVFVA